jgi:hypothetical protein
MLLVINDYDVMDDLMDDDDDGVEMGGRFLFF